MCDNNRSKFSNSNFGNNNPHREPSRFLDNRDPSRQTKKGNIGKTSSNLVTQETKPEPSDSESESEAQNNLTAKLTAVQANVNQFGYHQTLRVNCVGPKAVAPCNLIYDTGSVISMIEEGFAKSLGLKPIRKDTLELEGISSTKVKQKGFNVYKIGLKRLDNTGPKFDILVYGLEKVCNTHQHYDGKLNQELLKWGIEIGENQISDSNIQILVGGDSVWDFISGKIVRTSLGIVGIETSLGWTVQGRKETVANSLNVLFSTSAPVQ